MEVHHHPHAEKKSFKEYFLEFLMIFLAVTMGFIAENIREHISETKTAHEYLSSYRNDLQENQKGLKFYENDFTGLALVYDSIISIINEKKENEELPLISRLMMNGMRNMIVSINTSTYQQMVGSGSMRYLHNQLLKDSIAKYNDQLNSLINYNDRIVTTETNATEAEWGRIVDIHDFSNPKKVKSFVPNYQPDMRPFSLSEEQRRYLISYYKIYFIQAYYEPFLLRRIYSTNVSLLKMIDAELGQ